uniref:Transmembrane BAX inhibitor motif containing 4 n=1 Tax=Felis catus TaxID=9685 RepID=A0ABI7XEU8_FELCA
MLKFPEVKRKSTPHLLWALFFVLLFFPSSHSSNSLNGKIVSFDSLVWFLPHHKYTQIQQTDFILLVNTIYTVLKLKNAFNFMSFSPALILVFALGSLGLILALTVNRHKHPLNLYLLFGFTLFEALTVAFVVSFYDIYIILQAFILTTAVFLGLTAYTLQSKRDFSKFGAGLFAVLWILCLSGILKLFFYNETVELVLAAVGALLFCGFIIYDTHSLMHRLSPEEYVLAAISLYLDVINLFLHLLRFLEAVNKK